MKITKIIPYILFAGALIAGVTIFFSVATGDTVWPADQWAVIYVHPLKFGRLSPGQTVGRQPPVPGETKPKSGIVHNTICIHPLDPAVDMIAIRASISRGHYQEALQRLQPYLSRPLEYPRFYSDYLVLLIWTGRKEKGVELFSSLPAGFPKRQYLLENMAKGFHDLGRYSEAISLYRQILKKNPTDIRAMQGMIGSLLEQGHVRQGGTLLKKYLARVPNDFSLQLLQARVHMRQHLPAAALAAYHKLLRRFPGHTEEICQSRERELLRLSPRKRQELAGQMKDGAEAASLDKMQDYLLILALNRDYDQATRFYEKHRRKLTRLDPDVASWLGWSYFKKGAIDRALVLYHRILKKDPGNVRARIGIVYCLARQGKTDEAMQRLRRIHPETIDVRYARAYIYEKANRIWDAVREYDALLVVRDNPVARRLRLEAIAHLGGPTISLNRARKHLPADIRFQRSLRGDQAMHFIRWQEYDRALLMLSRLMEESDSLRYRYDSIIALVEHEDMEQATRRYEELVEKKAPIPYWVKDKAAKAYLYLEKPEKALSLYNEVLREKPDLFNARMGRIDTLQELRRWKEADVELRRLELEMPAFFRHGRKKHPNWDKADVAETRGWWFAYQDRLRDAEKYALRLQRIAPANIEMRNILAHMYSWRGWPRKAKKEFDIIHTLAPGYVAAETGRTMVLNELAYKDKARFLAWKLLAENPKNKHVQDLYRQLEVEDMRELVVDGVYYREEDDSYDTRMQVSFSQPLTSCTRLYGAALWNEVSDEDLLDSVYRMSLGAKHIFNSTWQGRQEFSWTENNGTRISSLTDITVTPNDYWSFGGSIDTGTLDIPATARVRGIRARQYSGRLGFRESEWRSYSLEYRLYDFSDDNVRQQWLAGYDQGLYVGYDWRLRLMLDLYTSSNSRDDAPYFNPAHDYSGSVTLMTEQTIRKIYHQAFVHRLFLTGGFYKQDNYAGEPLWEVRYEQEHDFSDVQALLLGANWSNRTYDGDDTSSMALYLTYRHHF